MASVSPEPRTRVFIVDDIRAICERLAEYVAEIGGADVVGTARTPEDAVAGILASRPDVVLLDFKLEGGTALDVLNAVHPVAPGIVFVVLTNHVQPPYRHACFAAGARHFLDKTTEFDRIAPVI